MTTALRKTTAALLCLTGTLLCSELRAEELYVIEYIVVNVNSEPDGSGERVATIRSGDRVEVIERNEGYVNVRLSSGAEGWVKAAYLSSDPPLRKQLEERNAEITRLRQQLDRTKSELAEARAAATRAQESAKATTKDSKPQTTAVVAPQVGEPGVVAMEQAPAKPEDSAEHVDAPPIFARPEENESAPGWRWVVGSSAATLIGGFALGWRTLDRRIRRKYGGLKIY